MPDKNKILSELDSLDENSQPNNLEEYWLMSAGETLYNKFSKDYNKKGMIDCNKEIDADCQIGLAKVSLFMKKGEMFMIKDQHFLFIMMDIIYILMKFQLKMSMFY